MTNPLKDWVTKSRKEAQYAPQLYLRFYPELVIGPRAVLMTKECYERIKHNCGVYNGSIPTGQYLGKMFLRNGALCWFGIDKEHPMTHVMIQCRAIIFKDEVFRDDLN